MEVNQKKMDLIAFVVFFIFGAIFGVLIGFRVWVRFSVSHVSGILITSGAAIFFGILAGVKGAKGLSKYDF